MALVSREFASVMIEKAWHRSGRQENSAETTHNMTYQEAEGGVSVVVKLPLWRSSEN